MSMDKDKLVRDALGEDSYTFQELVESVLKNEFRSTLPASKPFVQSFVPEGTAYSVMDSIRFGIRTPVFIDTCPVGA